MREVTGFDRVWVYRFHPDWHGEIIGESKRELRTLKESAVSKMSDVRFRDRLTRVNATVASSVGMDLWKETQDHLAKLRAKK